MNLIELQNTCIREQKKGLHFILTSILIWAIITVIHLTEMPILSKNLFTFCATSLLMPVAFGISKLLKVTFSNKENPLNQLGFIFSMNQMLYLLIAMWVYAAQPEKMVMVLAMIFGAHLLPFGWLYRSKSYTVLSIVITVCALLAGIFLPPWMVALMMVGFEIVFSVFLLQEVKKL